MVHVFVVDSCIFFLLLTFVCFVFFVFLVTVIGFIIEVVVEGCHSCVSTGH